MSNTPLTPNHILRISVQLDCSIMSSTNFKVKFTKCDFVTNQNVVSNLFRVPPVRPFTTHCTTTTIWARTTCRKSATTYATCTAGFSFNLLIFGFGIAPNTTQGSLHFYSLRWTVGTSLRTKNRTLFNRSVWEMYWYFMGGIRFCWGQD